MNEQPTPRTDAQTWINRYPEYHAAAKRYVDADFARELERELSSLRSQLLDAQKALEAANDVFEELSTTNWPQSAMEEFYGEPGKCPIDYSEAQSLVSAARTASPSAR